MDARSRTLSLRFDRDHIALNVIDADKAKNRNRDKEKKEKQRKLAMMVRYNDPLKSARARLIWNEITKQWRIFYGLNGDEANTELPESIESIYFTNPLSESTAAYLLVDHGSADFDHFEIRPFAPPLPDSIIER